MQKGNAQNKGQQNRPKRHVGTQRKGRGTVGGVQGWGNVATPHKTVERENLSINHERHVVLSGRTAERENNYRYECSAYAPVHTPLSPFLHSGANK